jgi:hypothetical protein
LGEVHDFPKPDPAAPDDLYTEVVVRARLADPDDTTGVGPNRNYRIWEEWPVYHNLTNPPEDGQTYFVDISSEDDPSLQYEADEAARLEAIRQSRILSLGQWGGSAIVNFNWLLEPYDTISFWATHKFGRDNFRVLWRCVIDSIVLDFLTDLSTSLTFRATPVIKEKITPPIAPMKGRTSGVVEAKDLGFNTWGEDEITFAELDQYIYDQLP